MAEEQISELSTQRKQQPHHNQTHGFASGVKKDPLYTVWQLMRGRCLNPTNPRYKDYGGRGIKICQRWLDSFENFFEDMGRKPSRKHKLDRRDNDGDYSKDNCRWVDDQTSCNNRRSNVIIEFQGIKRTMAEWGREKGIRLGTLHYRIKNGWSIGEALLTPVKTPPTP